MSVRIVISIGVLWDPSLTPSLLPPPQFPNLCRQFYTLVNYICESFPERLATLPEQLFLACMQLLERGVADYGVEVCTLSLESIEGVASSQARAESQSLGGVASSQESLQSLQSSQTLTQILEHFLKVLVCVCVLCVTMSCLCLRLNFNVCIFRLYLI